MNIVKPIKDIKKIEEIKQDLAKSGIRDVLLFTFGINSALRISDIIILTKADVKTGVVTIQEEKTGKRKEFPLNKAITDILYPYIEKLEDTDFIFQSRQVNREGVKSHISRQQAYVIINKACRNCGITEEVGTHTLRKTFGYHFYNKTKDVAMLQKLLNHSAPSITLRYIGIEQEEINNSYMNFCL